MPKTHKNTTLNANCDRRSFLGSVIEEKSPSYKVSAKPEAQISQELQVFGWNLRSIATPFERHSLALNAIEHGRAWHWRLLPAGWANMEFFLRHGQLKAKRAFATFFPGVKRTQFHQKQTMKIKKPAAGRRLSPGKQSIANTSQA